MVRIEKYNKSQYPMLAEWWKAHQWEPVAKEILGEDNGRVAYVEDEPVAAGWFYTVREAPQVGWIEWVVGNPLVDYNKRSKGLTGLLDELSEEAHKAGVKVLFSAAKHIRYIERLSGHGFKPADTGMTHMVKTWQR